MNDNLIKTIDNEDAWNAIKLIEKTYKNYCYPKIHSIYSYLVSKGFNRCKYEYLTSINTVELYDCFYSDDIQETEINHYAKILFNSMKRFSDKKIINGFVIHHHINTEPNQIVGLLAYLYLILDVDVAEMRDKIFITGKEL